MSYIKKPGVVHPKTKKNDLGLVMRDYEGGMSTLCAGCGHDSITAALIQAVFELNIEPHRIAKMSGIGCSSKTPAYFLSAAHGINSVHGRMPSVATGANLANRELHYIGVSGDGDSLSIGLGQFAHAVRRNLDMLYIIENNGVYGLTKGQFSASADLGTKAKKGDVNTHQPIDPVMLSLSLGASFVARSFSGDKKQLVPLIKAGLAYRGFALIDVLSPCVTFNDHEGSTKSYANTRENYHPAVDADYIPPQREIKTDYGPGETVTVDLHDGGQVALRKVSEDYDPRNRASVFDYLYERNAVGEIVTGLLYIDEDKPDYHDNVGSSEQALVDIDFDRLVPGADALAALQDEYC